ncbi:MAG: hypothetical protein ABI273_07155 [Lacunisphaera sp.]
MAHKIEKALYGPSLTEVVLGAILGLLAGVLVACVYLVFKPVLTVRELPKDQPRGMVYYIPGANGNSRGSGWFAKQKLFLAGKSVQLVADELNGWVEGTVKLDAPPAAAPTTNAKTPAPAGASNAIFTPSKPNFKIANDKLQIGMMCTLNWYGMMTNVVLQSTGTFTKDGDHYVYKPDTLYLGSCPLHLLPGVAGFLMSHIISTGKVPDEFRDAWYKLNDVEVRGGELKLVAAP